MDRRTSFEDILGKSMADVEKAFAAPTKDPWARYAFAIGTEIRICEIVDATPQQVGFTKDFNASLSWTAGRAYKERYPHSIHMGGALSDQSVLASFDEDGNRLFHS